MTAQDYFEPIRVLASSVLECNRKKLEKSYAAKTVLIVAFDDARLRGRGWWDLLYTAIKDMGGIERGNFQKVYLFNCCSNELQQVA